ncbi:NAD(P)-dependent dehydrogenase (short-subunit alcohol dehydrogenase family) [Inquilinus ginsengisoli]|uniref:NAD(P)-dependent dehydrogenase (Short-subunit alcohol dehydrogenase family) n=1 Tax=Inquilinus ginsengisoli TaxID=363840 RepID=A0ABU1JLN6_9PROT|nr:SDR family oxidoreductase [Inquilinus ginsengisoli]MDR6289505.1 NAD(P)-dependent dehydrogenase (short-subunit alcohol dehydrogenase family) [Inquilinus ginsengisoli]
MPNQPLQDKVAIIGGGAKNLGGLISRDLAAAGAKIVINFNSDGTKAAADATVAAIEAAGGQAFALQGDLTRVAEVERLFAEAKARFGRVDIAVNTAGKVLKKPFVETTEAEYDDMFAVNSKAAYFFLREAGKTLEDGGRIVTIVTSLLAAFTGLYSTYAGAKAPVEHFTRAAAKEFGARKISVNNVGPGPMDTPFFYPAETPDSVAYHSSASALGGLTRIEEIVPIVRFLVTEGSWITGQTLFANGGYATR